MLKSGKFLKHVLSDCDTEFLNKDACLVFYHCYFRTAEPLFNLRSVKELKTLKNFFCLTDLYLTGELFISKAIGKVERRFLNQMLICNL